MYRLALLPGSARSEPYATERSGPATPVSPQSVRIPKPRLSRNPKNFSKPSSLRPRVLAKDRISKWKSPWSNQSDANMGEFFPEATVSNLRRVVAASVEEPTLQNYGAGLLRFHQFCDRHGIPESLRMPASEPLLALFASEEGAGKVAGGTVASWLSGIELWHTVNAAPWAAGKLIRRTRQGIAKLAPPTSHREARSPVSKEHMECLRIGLDLSSTLDCSVWGLANSAWGGCARYDVHYTRLCNVG